MLIDLCDKLAYFCLNMKSLLSALVCVLALQVHAQSHESYLYSIGEISFTGTTFNVYSLVGQTVYEPMMASEVSLINFPNSIIRVVTGVEQEVNTSLYPNPMTNRFFIAGKFGSKLRFEIYNNLGIREMSGNTSGQLNEIDVTALEPGVYIVLLISDRLGSKPQSFKIIKSHDR